MERTSPERLELDGRAPRTPAPRGRIHVRAEPDPSPADLRRALAALARTGAGRARPSDLSARDPGFIRDVEPLMGLFYDRYFRCETEIDVDVPEGPVLLIGNHNGMSGTPDMFCHMTAFWRRYGADRVAHGLMHDVPFKVPFAGTWLNACGALAAGPDNARRALGAGAALLVFPGGDVDACKPFRDRFKIDFGRRRGFIRLALEEQIPVVPVVSAGAHESLFIYSDGQKIARALGLDRHFRSNVCPLGLALPWIFVLGVPYPHLPPPVKIHTRILAPIALDLPPSAANDPALVEMAYERVVGAMRTAMAEIREAGRHGLLPRADRTRARAALTSALRWVGDLA